MSARADVQRLASAADAAAWLRAHGATGLVADSRKVTAGDAFVAWPGYGHDGRQFVPAALQAGAPVCLVEADGVDAFAFDGAQVASLVGLKAATGAVAAEFHAHPSERLHVVAVTGTNGKTSSAWWVAQSLNLLGRRCGVVGTLGVGEPPTAASPAAQIVSTGLTTPDPVTLQRAFRRFADGGFDACAIEASSIGLVEHRLAGTRIEVALFTNFTRDHLDFHVDMESYWDAKAQLFAWPGLASAVVNVDDPQGASLAASLAGGSVDLWTCSASNGSARLRAESIGYRDGGLAFRLCEGEDSVRVATSLIGDYNVSNLLVVIGGLRALRVPLADAARVAPHLSPVPGRMDRVAVPVSRSGEAVEAPVVVVDYAHTPDALEKALRALRPFAEERGGRLWVVFGCGGDRDATKRPLMGGIAEREADRVVLTSDNPRSEPAATILRQIEHGMENPVDAESIVERRAAIAHAVSQADVDDVILLAGKGHETTQEISGVKLPFSDVEEARKALARRTA